MTYNVHQWEDEKRDPNFTRVVKVLQQLAADVIGLQEVRRDDQFAYTIHHIAKTLDMDFVLAEAGTDSIYSAREEPPRCRRHCCFRQLNVPGTVGYRREISEQFGEAELTSCGDTSA